MFFSLCLACAVCLTFNGAVTSHRECVLEDRYPEVIKIGAGAHCDNSGEALLVNISRALILALPDVVVCQRCPQPPDLCKHPASASNWQFTSDFETYEDLKQAK